MLLGVILFYTAPQIERAFDQGPNRFANASPREVKKAPMHFGI